MRHFLKVILCKKQSNISFYAKNVGFIGRTNIEKDTESLEKFYASVKTRRQGIDNVEGKQKIIIELYDKFFKSAFPKMVEKLGIVYTL